jgi:hypothetical protein
MILKNTIQGKGGSGKPSKKQHNKF